MKAELIDLWPENSVGHIDSEGNDIGRNFLFNLGNRIGDTESSTVSVYSHFQEYSNFQRMNRRIVRVLSKKFLSNLDRRKILHGYSTDYKTLNPNHINIWYTPENIRPPLNRDFDIFLSHDTDDYDGRNLYLPIWATRLGSTLESASKRQNEFSSIRNPYMSERKNICAVISNPEPIRMAFIKEITKYFPVDIYGALGMPIRDKQEILSDYKFNICFENDQFPGYVTEKPLEAWESGCIPIWWGNDIENYLNPEALINVSKIGFRNAIDVISASLESNEKFLSIYNNSILKKQFNYFNLENSIYQLVRQRIRHNPK